MDTRLLSAGLNVRAMTGALGHMPSQLTASAATLRDALPFQTQNLVHTRPAAPNRPAQASILMTLAAAPTGTLPEVAAAPCMPASLWLQVELGKCLEILVRCQTPSSTCNHSFIHSHIAPALHCLPQTKATRGNKALLEQLCAIVEALQASAPPPPAPRNSDAAAAPLHRLQARAQRVSDYARCIACDGSMCECFVKAGRLEEALLVAQRLERDGSEVWAATLEAWQRQLERENANAPQEQPEQT